MKSFCVSFMSMICLFMVSGCGSYLKTDKAFVQKRDLAAEQKFADVDQSVLPGVFLEFRVDQSGPNAGINSSVSIYNDNKEAREVKYERTIHSHNGGTGRFSKIVGSKARVWIGSTCAFDVTYSTLCGSRITYKIVN